MRVPFKNLFVNVYNGATQVVVLNGDTSKGTFVNVARLTSSQSVNSTLTWGDYVRFDINSPTSFSYCWLENPDGTIYSYVTKVSSYSFILNSISSLPDNLSFCYSNEDPSLPQQANITGFIEPPELGLIEGLGVYDIGSQCTLTAVPFGNNVFTHWSDGSTSNPYTFEVTEDINIGAYFSKPTYTVSVSSEDLNKGSVSGGGTFVEGNQCNLTATPTFDYVFSHWSDGSTSNPYSFEVTQDKDLIAYFSYKWSSPNTDIDLPNIDDTIETDTTNSSFVNNNISSTLQGSSFECSYIHHFNLYSINSTYIKFDPELNDYSAIRYPYSVSASDSGKFIFPVYDHTEVIVTAPNFMVSQGAIDYHKYLNCNIDDPTCTLSNYMIAKSDGTIARDINEWHYIYRDTLLNSRYSIDKLPITNSTLNINHMVYQGSITKLQSKSNIPSVFNLGLPDVDNGFQKFVLSITDSVQTLQQVFIQQNQSNQNILQNQNNQLLDKNNDLMENGNSYSQSISNSNDSSTTQFNTASSQYDSLEEDYIDNMINELSKINLADFDISTNPTFTNAMSWVKTQFDRMISNNAFGILIGFSLMLGLALIVINKRLN